MKAARELREVYLKGVDRREEKLRQSPPPPRPPFRIGDKCWSCRKRHQKTRNLQTFLSSQRRHEWLRWLCFSPDVITGPSWSFSNPSHSWPWLEHQDRWPKLAGLVFAKGER
ncbi:hypothetical protein L3X38_001665 [Prunus dulcis]|uniref:Uncharacterized protein n=1 Tax=Prunus dulcis TaxID=3755 RepID=A0AAD4WSZ0_PRUDU|nr:hypothetical protein L3X38_001665 [Prunus dulcis]